MSKRSRRRLQMDSVRLGADVATAKQSMDPAVWRQLVKTAHKRGFSVRGQLSNLPDPLKERTRAGIVKEAQARTKSAYAPVYGELDTQERGAMALAEKRRQDNASFREWLNTKSEALKADARGADALLNSRLGQIQRDTQDAWRTTAEQAHANAAAQAGVVSDTGQSTALQGLATAAANENEKMGAHRTALTESSAHSVADVNIAAAAMLATQAVADAKNQGDLTTSLNDIRGQRAKYGLQQAADTDKITGDLLSQEVSKAESQQQLGIAAEKLGVSRDELNLKTTKAANDLKIANKNFNLHKWIAKNQKAAADAKVQLGYDQIAASKGKAAADRALKKWIAQHPNKAGGGTNGGPNATQQKASQDLYRTVSTVKGQILDLHRRFPAGTTGQGRGFREVLRSRGYDDITIDIAEDLRVHNGKLSKAGRDKARRAGILHPERLWGVA